MFTGLRALLRFLTGFYVCLNRGDIHTNVQQVCFASLSCLTTKSTLMEVNMSTIFFPGQHSAEAAGRSLVSLVVDHIFLRIKDAG